jgi:hypothetical protein
VVLVRRWAADVPEPRPAEAEAQRGVVRAHADAEPAPGMVQASTSSPERV